MKIATRIKAWLFFIIFWKCQSFLLYLSCTPKLLFTIPDGTVCLEKEDLYMDKTTFNQFYSLFNEFMDWVGEKESLTGIDGSDVLQDADVSELTDKEEIRKAFKEHRTDFSVPILAWEILNMSWLTKTGFWYDGVYINPADTGDILSSGFAAKGNNGVAVGAYHFADYINDEVCCDWVKMVESIADDVEYWNRYNKELPF